MEAKGYEDIRVNQVQVANGRVMGRNRPDVQGTHPRTKKRINVEVDTSAAGSAKHQAVLPKNDPDAVNTFIVIDAAGNAVSGKTIR